MEVELVVVVVVVSSTIDCQEMREVLGSQICSLASWHEDVRDHLENSELHLAATLRQILILSYVCQLRCSNALRPVMTALSSYSDLGWDVGETQAGAILGQPPLYTCTFALGTGLAKM